MLGMTIETAALDWQILNIGLNLKERLNATLTDDHAVLHCGHKTEKLEKPISC